MAADRKAMAMLFIVSLIVRLAAFAVVPSPPIDDSAEAAYLAGASKLLAGEGFWDASYPVYAPPLYAIFIALCEFVLGNSLDAVKFIQLLIDSMTVVLIFLLMRKLFGVATAFVAGTILALYPFSIYLGISIAAEPLATFFLAGFVLLAVHAIQLKKLEYFAAAGVVLALATLTRATTQFLPFFFLLLLPFLCRRGRLLLKSALFLLSYIFLIMPWTIRNYVVLDDFIPVATGGGVIVLMGSQERYLTIPGKPEMYKKHPPKEGSKPSELDRHWTNAALTEHMTHLEKDPVGFVKFNILKFLRLWYATESGKNHMLTLGANLPIYILACIGVLLAFSKQRRLVLIPLCVIGYYVLLHWASLPLFRYMMPVMPYVIGFAAFATVELAEQRGLARSRQEVCK